MEDQRSNVLAYPASRGFAVIISDNKLCSDLIVRIMEIERGTLIRA